MEPNKDPAKREREIPMDTPLNPEAMSNIDGNRLDSTFAYAGDSTDKHKDSEQTSHDPAEEIDEPSNDNL